ncbi:MAG: cadherin-like domain-containing protein, partial [Rubrivivax sp.]|nr:cadherin-like domain-containing protein [Rubrivivax sp.]
LQVLSLDITGTQGTVTAFADGRFSFTPAPGLATDTSFAYTLVDSAGRTAKATAFFDMVSTLPVAVNDSYTPNAANFFVPAAQGLLANDSGGIGTLQVLSLDITGTQGTVTAFADGRFGFTPDPGLATDTSFAYTLVDSAGRTRKATAFFDMVSTLPVAVDDIYTLNATTLNVPVAQGVLANDSGGIGKLQVLSLDITGTQGTVTAFSDGHFSFTPDPGLATDTSFAYTMLDEAGRTRKATVLLDVLSTLPVGVDDFYDLLGAGPFSTTALDGLLGNDRGGLGGLELAGVDDSGLQGTLTVLADGSFTFDPRSGFRGTTSFDYVLVDALGRTSRSTATLRVGPAFPVPEPATAALLLIAGGALCARRQRHGAWAAGRSRSATLCAVRAG